jgi:hypothetical protein
MEERLPSGSRLYRKAEELTDDQFDLLAAAWAEDSLSGDALAELESVISADSLRMARAESFRNIRLAPGNETWPGLRYAIKPSPVLKVIRGTVIPAILAVAAMIVIIISGPAGAKLKTADPGKLTADSGMAAAEIYASSPVIAVKETSVATMASANITRITAAEDLPESAVPAAIGRIRPLILAHSHTTVSAVAPAINTTLVSISPNVISYPHATEVEQNWMLRSVSFLAAAVTGRETKIDGYAIANGCITGLNTVLGWEMELEQVSNKRGDHVAVSFSSSLLSFTRPVNKTTP